jgi:hypothetical protein
MKPARWMILIGGHIVLLNRRTNRVVDIFHFETNLVVF